MKTILRIIIILLVASAVAGAFFLVVNNGTTTSEGGQPPAMTSADRQTMPLMQRPQGGEHDGGSIAGGISGVVATLGKLSAITMFVLLLEKGMEEFNSPKWKLARG